MTTTQVICNLWDEMRGAINKAYADTVGSKAKDNDERGCLREYAENISWSDNLSALLGRETANERQHRRNRPMVAGFSVSTAAKLILMECVRKGAEMDEAPRAAAFLVLRQTAVEAEVVGFLAKEHLAEPWRKAVASLDYAKLMQA